MTINKVLRLINFYPPLFFAGIRLKSINDDITRLEVRMRLNIFNRNMFGTHFGGSLYAMCDPFYVFIIAAHLTNEYVIWDKSAYINFVRPGKGRVTAVFEITKEQLADIKYKADNGLEKSFFFETEVKNAEGKVVAQVKKEVYVRKK